MLNNTSKRLLRFIVSVPMLLLIFAFPLCSCSKKPDIFLISPKITQTSHMRWKCYYDKTASIEAEAYLFNCSDWVPKRYQERMEYQSQRIIRTAAKRFEAPTKQLRKLYEEEYEGYQTGRLKEVDSSENWPIMMVTPVLTEKGAKAIAICRYEKKKIDVVFTMYCPDEIDECGIFLKLAKDLTKKFEEYNEKEWNNLVKEDSPLYDSEGNIESKKLLDFVKDAIFIPQH